MPQPRPITFAGMSWPSVTDCAEALGIEYWRIAKWVRAGLDDFPPGYDGRSVNAVGPYRFGGRLFPTTRAIGEHYRVSRTTAYKWITEGLTEPPAVIRRPRPPVWFAGRHWPTQEAIAEGLGYDRSTISVWLSKGLTEPPGNKVPRRGPFTFNGKTHRTLADLALHEGIGWRTARRWVNELGLTETPEWHRPIQRPDDGRLNRNRGEDQ